MNKVWTLREEYYRTLHQWPSMLIFIALGCLAGLIGAYLWPRSYRATTLISVALNPYRTYSDVNFLALASPKYSNIDEYKHWQMSQLESTIFLDDFMADTLTELRLEDSYWESTNIDQLRAMLEANWRSAGTWSLVADHSDSLRAAQATKAWSAVVVDRVTGAVQSARNTFMTDQELQEVTDELVQFLTRQEQLAAAKESLLAWNESAGDLAQDQPLDSIERWRLTSLAAQIAQFNPGWMAVLDAQPVADAHPDAYVNWLDLIISSINAELSGLPQRINMLEKRQDELAELYTLQADASLSLSPNIEIEAYESLPPEPIRPTSLFLLVGGIGGLCVWLLIQLVKINKRVSDQ